MFLKRLCQIGAFLGLLPLCLFGVTQPLPRILLNSPTLTAPEKFVVAQAAAGKSANLKTEFPDEEKRVLRAGFLEALLTANGTNIHRNGFSIEHALIEGPLNLRNATVHHETSLIECRFTGESDFSKSVFENGLSLAGSRFDKPITFSSIKIGRIVVLDKATFDSEVNAAQMEVKGVLSAREAHFTSATAKVDFTGLTTTSDVSFSGTTFAGPVTFQSAHIIENWRFDGSQFTHTNALIDFEEVKADASTSFVACRFDGYISFNDARFSTLDLSKVIWPKARDNTPWLWLNGMTFGRISAGSEKDSWQNLYQLIDRSAHGTSYSADVFSSLGDYYRKLGYPRQANAFFLLQKKRERQEVLSGGAWIWSFFLEQFVGYGRSPERAIFWSVAIIAFGCVMFRPSRMEVQKSEFTQRKYSPFWYSVDVYLPIIKLHDAEVWKPREECTFTHVWRRIHTVLGWALIPIALAAWTGMLSQ